MIEDVLRIAKWFIWAREIGGQNRGAVVKAFLNLCGLPEGYPWCAAFVSTVLYLAGAKKPPATAGCEVLRAYAVDHGVLYLSPQKGDIFLEINAKGQAHHTGFVAEVPDPKTGTFKTIEGNSNPAGGNEGYGVFEETRTLKPGLYKFLRWSEMV